MKKQTDSGAVFHGPAQAREHFQEVYVIEQAGCETFGGIGMFVPRPAHDTFEIG